MTTTDSPTAATATVSSDRITITLGLFDSTDAAVRAGAIEYTQDLYSKLVELRWQIAGASLPRAAKTSLVRLLDYAQDLYLDHQSDLFALYGTILLAKIDSKFAALAFAVEMTPDYAGPDNIDEVFLSLIDSTAAALELAA